MFKNYRSGGLYQLRQENRARHVANSALCGKVHAQGDLPTIYLYDVIDSDPYWGFSALQLADLLGQIDAPRMRLRINSPGGDVFEAQSMFQLLAEHPSELVVMIDGLAASAATYVALAGNHRIASEGAFYMVHNAWTYTVGDYKEHEKSTENLKKVDASIAAKYEKASSLSLEQLREYMDQETWWSAEEAKELGFVHEVFTPEVESSGASNWALAAYKNAPKGVLSQVAEAPPRGVPDVCKRRSNLIQRNI